MQSVFALILVVAAFSWCSPAVAEVKAAPLLRVAIDNQVADRQRVRSFEFETVLVSALREVGLQHQDLTPLHDDFQTLRYSQAMCEVVDGASTDNDCAQFGNYAEAVLEVLDNIRTAQASGLIPGLTDEDWIIIMNANISLQRRAVRVNLFYRVHQTGQSGSLMEDSVMQNLDIPARGTEQGTIDRLMSRALRTAVKRFAKKLL